MTHLRYFLIHCRVPGVGRGTPEFVGDVQLGTGHTYIMNLEDGIPGFVTDKSRTMHQISDGRLWKYLPKKQSKVILTVGPRVSIVRPLYSATPLIKV